jgi:hypothetical protein
MSRQKRKQELSAAVAIYLALNIQVQDDRGPDWMVAIPLLPLNFWLWWGWQGRLVAQRLHRSAIGSLDRWGQGLVSLYQNLVVTIIFLGIGCKASLYGLGVTR